jgi:hypothetical protein
MATKIDIIIKNGMQQHPPVAILPTLRCLPDFVRGIPVDLDIFDFARVIPVARFQEKPPWFAMLYLPLC